MKKLLFAVALLAGCVNQAGTSDDSTTTADEQTETMNAASQAVTIPDQLVDTNAQHGCTPCTTDVFCRNSVDHCGPFCVADPLGGPDHCGQLPP